MRTRKLRIGTWSGEPPCEHTVYDYWSAAGISLLGWQVKAALDNSIVEVTCSLCDVPHKGSLTGMYFHLRDFHGYTPEQLGAPPASS